MKTIGLIGGMSWESTVTYYQIMNEEVKKQMGGFHSAKILLYSVDFAEIEECLSKGDWEKSERILSKAACSLETAGADFIVIGTNTLHKVTPQMQTKLHIPIIHIAEATALKLREHHIQKVALLGTIFTMTQEFYRDKLEEAGIEVLIPNTEDMELINHVIFKELCLGIISDESKKKYSDIISKLAEEGAEGVILGCTEIGLLIKQEDSSIPVFDTTQIHATKAAELAMMV